MRFLPLLFCLLLITGLSVSCREESAFSPSEMALAGVQYTDENVELYASSSRIRVESSYWHQGVSVQLMDADQNPLGDPVRMTSESFYFTAVTPATLFWVAYDLRLSNGKIKHGVLAINTSPLVPEGYLLGASFLAGQIVPLQISSPASDVTVVLYRATNLKVPLTEWTFTHVGEHLVSRTAASSGCGWPSAGSIRLPEELTTGYYVLRLKNQHGGTWYPFVVRPTRRDGNRLAVFASTNTWAAYNFWGSASFYRNSIGGPQLLWSAFDRPLGPNVFQGGHLIAGELELAKWLENNGIDFDVYSDEDLDANRIGDSYNTWIFHVHSEYWTANASHAYSNHMEAGKRAIFLSGNNIWWLVSYVDGGRRMYKNGYHSNHGSGNFTATLYTPTGYGTTAAYQCLQPGHWVFEGTGLTEGEEFGQDGKFGGASGHETDKVAAGADVTILAKGMNPDGGGAEMVVAKILNGEIFNVGSLTFNGTLAADERTSRILKNVIRKYNGQ